MIEFALLEMLLDDTVAGGQSDQDLNKLRRITSKSNRVIIKDGEGERSRVYKKSLSMPGTLVCPATPVTPTSVHSNAWRSAFHPGSSVATKGIGADKFDKLHQPNSPTIYDCLYSGDETRNKFHR